MSEWFKDWFASEEYLQVYLHRDNDEAEQLISFLLNEISIPQNSFVLDAACGAGRHSKIFSDRNYKVFGFDLSKTLLKLANEFLNGNVTNSHFICADLRNVCYRQKFDLVVNLFTSFGYFNSDSENLSFIVSAFDLLKSNGYYIFDYLNSNFIVNNLVKFSKKVVGKKEIFEERKIVNGRVEKIITITNGLTIKKYKESVKLYSYRDIESMFTNIGFKIVKSFGDYQGNMFNESTSPRMLIIFKK